MNIGNILEDSFKITGGIIGAGVGGVTGIWMTNVSIDIFFNQLSKSCDLRNNPEVVLALTPAFFMLRAHVFVESTYAGFSQGKKCGEVFFRYLGTAIEYA